MSKLFENLEHDDKRRLTFGFIAGIFVGLAIAGITASMI